MNKTLCFFSILCFSLFLSACSGGTGKLEATITGPSATVYVIDGATVWDGTGQPAINDAVVVVNGDRIQAIGARGSVQVPADALVVQAKGKTLIPGLINAHGHVGMTKGLKAGPENYGEENVLAQLRQYARYGVTTVMSLGADLDAMFKLRGPARADEKPRATVFTAGRGFTGKMGYPAVLPGNAGVPREVDTVEEVRTNVEELAKQKVDMVKIWVDDHWGHYKKIRPELYRAIISEAHSRGLRVMAHIFYLEDARQLVETGLDGMGHSVRDKEVDAALIQSLKKTKTFAVPTLVREESTFVYATPPAFLDDLFFNRWIDPEVIKQLKDPAWGARVKADPDFAKYPGQLKMAQKNLKKLWDAGIPIAFGSDTGPPARFQGFFEHRELELMVEAGLTPAQALQTATSNAAEALRIASDFGTLATGKRADMILLDADPLADIRNTRKINKVWIGGREVERPFEIALGSK
ncbi:MAG: amidohydrolase family protein [Blastocatellia bacterium]